MRPRGCFVFRNWRQSVPRVTLFLEMLPDLKLAIRLQEIDHRLGELAREIATLPVHIAEIEKKLVAHQRKLDADHAALSANQKERKKCEGDIQTQEQKISKLKDQMLQAKTNEQYRAFQNEIDFCQAEIRKAEDRILELMGESEPLDKNVKAAEVALKNEKAQVETEKQQARERTAVDQKAAAELQTERAGLVKQMTPAVHQRYEKVRKARRGIGVAEAIDGRCSVCNMAMRPQFFQELKRGDQVMSCESCLRILYYNPPVAFDEVAGETAPAVRE
jgi:predicted  nucleic acid-binding Zn-ribbon protein